MTKRRYRLVERDGVGERAWHIGILPNPMTHDGYFHGEALVPITLAIQTTLHFGHKRTLGPTSITSTCHSAVQLATRIIADVWNKRAARYLSVKHNFVPISAEVVAHSVDAV